MIGSWVPYVGGTILVKVIRKVLNGHEQTLKTASVVVALLSLSGYLATEVYGNLKSADVRIEGQLIAAVGLLRAEAKERSELDEKRWDKQSDVNDAMIRALESMRDRTDRKP